MTTTPMKTEGVDISPEAVERAASGAELNGQRWLAEMLRELSRSLTASEKQVEKLQATFRHIHVANNTDGMLTDDCKQCGLDLRNPVHQRHV